MNKLFVDTDVILDMLGQRLPHFHFSAVLFTLAKKKKLELYISPLILANRINAYYVVADMLVSQQYIVHFSSCMSDVAFKTEYAFS